MAPPAEKSSPLPYRYTDKEHYDSPPLCIAEFIDDPRAPTPPTIRFLHNLSPAVCNPSEQQINEVVQKVELLKNASSIHTCYNLNDGRYVKVSNALNGAGLEEACIMDFIRIHTKIPVPQVHMAFERGGEFYNVMDYIPGERLSRSYETCSGEDLQNIANQLADIIQQIRTISIPQQNVIGSWDGKPFKNTWFKPLPWDGNVTPCSVFYSVAEYNDYWIRRSKLDIAAPDFGSTQVLSHGDLNAANIIVKNGEIGAILDWDTFGWYPDFWELIPPRIWVKDGRSWLEALDRTFGPEIEVIALYKTLLISAFSKPVDAMLIAKRA